MYIYIWLMDGLRDAWIPLLLSLLTLGEPYMDVIVGPGDILYVRVYLLGSN